MKNKSPKDVNHSRKPNLNSPKSTVKSQKLRQKSQTKFVFDNFEFYVDEDFDSKRKKGELYENGKLIEVNLKDFAASLHLLFLFITKKTIKQKELKDDFGNNYLKVLSKLRRVIRNEEGEYIRWKKDKRGEREYFWNDEKKNKSRGK